MIENFNNHNGVCYKCMSQTFQNIWMEYWSHFQLGRTRTASSSSSPLPICESHKLIKSLVLELSMQTCTTMEEPIYVKGDTERQSHSCPHQHRDKNILIPCHENYISHTSLSEKYGFGLINSSMYTVMEAVYKVYILHLSLG